MGREPLRWPPETLAEPGAEKIAEATRVTIDDDPLERVDYYGNPVQEDGDREALSKPEIAQG